MNPFRNSRILSLLAFIILITAFGCKNSKKALEASNAAKERARLEQEAALKQKQKEEEENRWREAEERARLEAERLEREKAAQNAKPAPSSEATRLSSYFETIANSSNITSANNNIKEALSLFASPQTPVLIVISEYNGQKDYDKPTTIENYLNYLKDQKKNINTVSNLKMNNSGKIMEVELRKTL
jgi:hypothetical protein